MRVDMEKRGLIEQIKQLKMIKPETNWLILSKKEILAKISLLTPKSIKRPIFVFSWSYKLAAVIFSIMLLFSGTALLAQSASVNSPLYGLKIAMAKAIIALAPAEERLDLKLALIQNISEDLVKVAGGYHNQLALETINQNLSDVASQLRKATHPSEVVMISGKIQKETLKIKEELKQVPTNKPEVASSIQKLEKQIKTMELETFALKNEAEQKISNCPLYLDKSLTELKEKIDNIILSDEQKEVLIIQLKEAGELLINNRCVDSLVMIDKIEKELGL